MNRSKRLIARRLPPGRLPLPSTPNPSGDFPCHAGSPPAKPKPHRPALRLRPWRALALTVGLIIGSAAHAELSATPNPSANGSYTVSWTSVAGASKYQLREDGTIVFEGKARSKAFSGKPAGSYAYTLSYCTYFDYPVVSTICNVASNFDALTVTVSGAAPTPPPAAPTLTVPANSSTGSYTVSWTRPSGATRFELQEKAGAADWQAAYAGSATSSAFANKGAGSYAYRVRACAGAGNCGGWSASGSVRVVRFSFSSTITASPNPAPGGNYKVSWTAVLPSASYRLRESFNGGTPTVHTVVGLSKAFANKSPGSYAYGLEFCFTLLGHTTCQPISASVTVTVPAPAPTGTISANPSPCTIPVGETLCSTTISWSTQNAGSPCVYLKGSQGKFACGRSGAKVAPWIHRQGRTLELRNGGTYAAAALASVFVKGVPAPTPAPTVSAAFNVREVKLGGSATLSWSSSNATSCSGSPSLGATSPSGSTAFTPGAVGNFSVTVTCAGDGGSGSATAQVHVVDVPDAPAQPTVSASGSTRLTVAWTAPRNNGSAIRGYEVRHRINAGNAGWGNPSSAGTGTSAILSGLAANTDYQVQVRARNRLGTGNWSAPGRGRTSREAAAPTVTAAFNDSKVKRGGALRLTWTATNATGCSSSPNIGVTGTSGSATVRPANLGGYSVTVTCVGAGGRGSATATAKVVDAPAKPAAPILTPSGRTSLGVTWNAPADNGSTITDYDVQYRVNVVRARWQDHPFSGTATSTVISGLSANPTYEARVRATNGAGTSPWSESGKGRTGTPAEPPPSVPAAFNVPQRDADGNYEISWQPSTGAVRYQLQERILSGSWTDAYEGDATSAALKDRRITTYGYRVRACAGDAESSCSGWTGERKATVSGELTANPNPSSNGSYTVTWTPALFARQYRLLESADGGATWPSTNTLTATRKAFSGKADGAYVYQVQSCIDLGSLGGWVCTPLFSSQLTVTVARSLAPPTLSIAPDPAPDGAYRVSWTTSRNAAGYRLRERANNGDWSDVTGVTGEFKDFSNPSAAVYGYQVKACDDGDKCGSWSVEATVRVPPAAPTVSGECGNGSYQLSWTAAAGAANTVVEQRAGTGPWTEVHNGSGNRKALTLAVGTSHSFRAKACAAAANCSDWGATLAVTAPNCAKPDVPGNLRLDATGPDGYGIRWNAVSGSGIRYVLERKQGSGDWQVQPATTGLIKSYSNQAAGTYRYRLRARSGSNLWSGHTDELSVTVPIAPPVPANLTVSEPNANRSFQASWDKVPWTDASYRLQETQGTQVAVESLSVTSRTFTAKPPGTYQYRVSACAPASNCGSYGAAQSVTVPPDAPATPSLACSGNTHRLSWPEVLGATSYRVQQRQGQGGWNPAYSVQNNSDTLSLTVGGQYGFQVKACADNGSCGDWSAAATATAPDCAKPGVPGGLAITPTGPGSYKVAWNAASGTVRAYQLQERIGSGAWQEVHSGANRERTFTGKANGAYSYQARACPQSGACSDYSAPQSITVPIPAPIPSGLMATTPDSNGGYAISWNTVTWGGAVTYALEERPAGGAWTEVHNGAAATLTVAGKANGSYAYRARACAGGACGGWSAVLTVTVANAAAAKVETPPAPYIAQDSLVTAAEIKAIDATGTIAGAFRVTESGAASYRIPIYATPGTAGVTPELALAYNSQGGNGVAGLGWTLEGGSAITRCRATRHQDGAAKPIQWNAQDKFCLDGQRLVLESGTYGAPGSSYRTEIDSFATVTAVGGTAGHPDHFEVRRKDGSVSHYGNVPGGSHTDAKRRNGKGQTLTWALKRLTDSVGNPVWHIYAGGADSHRLAEVRYAYGSTRGIDDHHAAVKLIYQDRNDGMNGYVAGHKFDNRKRLAKVRTLGHGGTALKVVRELRLAYGSMTDNKTSLLNSITECAGAAATAACKPATTFTRPGNAAGFKLAASGSADLTPRKDRGLISHHPADINGDGMMDLVWVEWDKDKSDTDHHIKYALSMGGRLQPAAFDGGGTSIEHMEEVNNRLPNVLARPIDYNGDGRTDVAVWRIRDAVWRVHLSVPTLNGGWRLAASTVETSITSRHAAFTDINGDGLVDAVYPQAETDDSTIATMRARHLERDAMQPETSSQPYKFGAEATLITVPGARFHNSGTSPGPNIDAAGHDFNGDGRADFITTAYLADNPNANEVEYTRPARRVYVSGPTGWRLYANFHGAKLHAADLNGDGLTDLVREGRSGSHLIPRPEINTGTGFTTLPSVVLLDSDKTALLPPTDVTGDGQPDLIWHDRRNKSIKALPFDPTNGWLAGDSRAILVAPRTDGRKTSAHLFLDADGDGAVDYLRISDTSSKGKLETFPSKNAGRFPRQVSGIRNGLGAVTDITHESLARTDHYERLDVRRTVFQPQFCYGFAGGSGCLPYANPIDPELKDTDEHGNPLSEAQKLANAKALLAKRTDDFHAKVNGGWNLPAGAQTLGKAGPVLEFRAPLPVVTRVEGTAPAAGAAPGNVATGATSAVEHFYADAKVQAMGRGPLGFGQLKTKDMQTGVETTTRYRHDFPFTGLPVSTVAALPVKSDEGTVLRRLSESATTWKLTGFQAGWKATAKASGTAALGAFRPHAARTVEKSYDLNGGTDADPNLLTAVTTDLEHDAHGNATKLTVTTEGGGRVFRAATENEYGPSDADRRLGRLTATTVTHARRDSSESEADALKAVRKSTFAYYGQSACPASNSAHAGLLCKEVAEPDHERLKVTATHAYDAFGNRVRSKVAYFDDLPVPGQAAPTGDARIKTRCDHDTAAYGARGRFVKARFDCEGRKLSEVEARDAHGSPTKVRRFLDKAGTRFVTDRTKRTPGGAEALSASATGAHAIATRAMGAPKGGGAAACPAGTAFHERVRHGGGGESVTCLDALAREVRTARRGFDGAWIHVDTEHDALGRVRRVSEPHYAGEAQCSPSQGDSKCWTATDHDILGRAVEVTGPDGSATTFARRGLATTTTNALGQAAKEARNALGETVLTEDHHGGTVAFARDAQGNVTATTRRKPPSDASPAPASVATTATFDLLGRMTAQDDPDLGRVRYLYNSLGEPRCRQDAAGNLTVTAHDGLGRMASRRDYRAHGAVTCDSLQQAQAAHLEGDASWAYDDGNGLGQLSEVRDAASGYRRTQRHDALGRPSTAETVPGTGAATHHEKATYDRFGRPFQHFDASRAEARFDFNGTRRAYNANGHLERLQDAEGTLDGQGRFTPKVVYRTVTAMDARGNVTAETLGNGVRRAHAFDGRTGRLLGIESGRSSATDLQDLAYQWDALGNLKSRTSGEGASALTETFGYDGLNRLASRRLGAGPARSTTYDGYGNIRSRAGAGTYAYGADSGASGRPHAAASVTRNGATVTHGYDANGSLTSSSDGRTVAYAAFGKAKSVSRDGRTSTFAHGPDRARFRRADDDGNGNATTTLYLGNVERVTHPDATVTVRRRIGGVAIALDGPARGGCEADAVRYVLRDHLGSVDVLADASGAAAQSMGFTAWGARRNPDGWTALADAAARSFDACATARGFTGHEMLDAVGAVHMNGRLYDPALGRFLRADPFVQFPKDLQGHNRYSYALNNPLSYTDPSGHFILTLAASAFIATATANIGLVAVVSTLAAAGFGDALLHGASFRQALQAGFASGVSAGAFSGIGTALQGRFGGTFAAGLSPAGFGLKALAHGTVGGITGALGGGRFGHGFASGGLAALGSGLNNSRFVGRAGFSPLRVAVGAAIGGTASRVTGGKFANGALTGTFSQALNNERAEARNRSELQAALEGLRRDGTLDPGRDFEHPDDAAMHVLNAATPLSAEHGLEVAGSIYETREGRFRYTFPQIGEASRASLTIRYRGYHTHPSGELVFSNDFTNTGDHDYNWVRTARKNLYLGVVGERGAVRIGVCEYGKCFGSGRFGTDPSRVLQ